MKPIKLIAAFTFLSLSVAGQTATPKSIAAPPDSVSDPNDLAKREEPIFLIVEKMPEFKGGENAMKKFISENIMYPKQEYDKGISGTCYVAFVVDKDGSITDVQISRGIQNGPACNAEAKRVVQSMPKWTPGIQNGRAVKVRYTMPVKFTNEKPAGK